MILEERYKERCRDAGREPMMDKFQHSHQLGRAFINECTTHGGSGCPYLIVSIDGYFNYFVKKVEDTVFPAILTTDELDELGYGGQDEPHYEGHTGDEVREIPHQGTGEDGI